MIELHLTRSAYEFAALAGEVRHGQNLKLGRRDAYAFRGNGLAAHRLGAVGEYAVAKSLGLFWDGPGELRAPDVGLLEVRTRSRHSFDLIVHPRDPDERAVVLVTCEEYVFRIHGWIWARDAKRERWWRDPAGGRPAYFVPQSALYDLSHLSAARQAA
jgi:hypothetical protein